MTTLTAPLRTLDEVECELARVQAIEGRLAAEKLRLIREADRMQARLVDGARSMADWTAARLDVAPETARSLVATARGLESLPDLEASLGEGLVSLDRTVELCRAAVSDVDVADHWGYDIAGLRRVISHRRGRTRSDDREAFDARYLVLQPSLDRSLWRLHGLLPGADGAVVESALDRRADQMTEGVPERPALSQRRADALVDLCHTNRDGTTEPLITVFVDSHGATISGHLPVGPDTVDEAACLGSVETIDITDPARPLARGHKTRVVSPQLRRTVFHRDGGICAIDGCQSRYRLQAHHIISWTDHGPTDPDNLTSLCYYHHHIVIHGHGRRLDPTTPPQARRFLREPGRAPPPC